MKKSKGLGLEDYLLEVSNGKTGFVPSLLRGGLGLLAPVYCAGLEIYLLPYNLGIRKRTRLDCPVICIGNLTTGGTGKTPMTQTLCRLLQAQGKEVVILSRGYGGENEYGCAVVSDHDTLYLNAREAGDEAFLLAVSLPGIPVVVGKDRRIAGKLAVERFKPDVIVLDDGLQFWQLHRDLDIVLLNASRPFDNGWTFPRGLLREPPSHLRRAGMVVLTNARKVTASQLEALQRRAAELAPNASVFTADLIPLALRSLTEFQSSENNLGDSLKKNNSTNANSKRENLPIEWLKGKRVTALSALGNPQSFEETVTGAGGEIVYTSRFRDHQEITNAMLSDVVRASKQAGAQALITTEKDAVKMDVNADQFPCYALQVAMQVDHEADVMTRVLKVIQN